MWGKGGGDGASIPGVPGTESGVPIKEMPAH